MAPGYGISAWLGDSEYTVARIRLKSAASPDGFTAITYVTTIDHPARFQRSRDIGAPLGLTLRKYASGEIDRNGAI